MFLHESHCKTLSNKDMKIYPASVSSDKDSNWSCQ